MLSSAEFVEALDRLGFPDASSLNPSDFDWAFESSSGCHDFFHFICRTLNKSNVITAEEARAFQKLKESGKPILDEAALSKVLKTLAPSDESAENDPALLNSSSSTCGSDDDLSIEELEEELQMLEKEKALKERRCNKLQVFAISGAGDDQQLNAELESAKSKMNAAMASIEVENTDTNTLLEGLTDKLHQLESHLAKEGEQEQVKEGDPVARVPEKRTALLSQLSLDSFLELEKNNRKKLALLLKSPLNPSVSELLETSSTAHSTVDRSAHADEEENRERLVAYKRAEMARIQWSYIMAQYQLIQATAEENGLMAGIKWLSDLSPAKYLSKSPLGGMTEDELVKELQATEVKLEEMLRDEDIPALLRKAASSLSVPVVSADLDIQLAKCKDYSSVQSEVIDYLLRHQASLCMILVALKEELKKWTSYHSDLEKLHNQLVKDREAASLRMESLARLDQDQDLKPSPVITSKDASFSRLLHFLEDGSSHDRPDPLQRFSDLDDAAQALTSDLESNRAAAEVARREQRDVATRLAGRCEKLHQVVYNELQHLFLGPHAHPVATAGKALVLPNAQELTAHLFEVETQLQSLQKQLQEVMGEIRAKRSELERNKHLRQERELYIHFNLNPEKLEKIVQDVESKGMKKKRQK
ncbi:HAUS augmin-like complex subunit 3 isoform X2 [Salarias fasciatus]|nr:HAUS augmin-like complex subunit 3 isoform X2 [Salarias fasciatus]